MKCRLTLQTTEHKKNPLRTQKVVGICDYKPTKGQVFRMRANPLESGDIRIIVTSVIQKRNILDKDDKIEFQTENSNYLWEFLDSNS